MKKLFLLLIISISYSCHLPWDNIRPPIEKTTVDFLNALKSKNSDLSKSYCTEKGANFIDSCIRESLYFQVTEVKDVKCSIDSNCATCTFCCLPDSLNPSFTMIKKDNKWLVDDLNLIFSHQ